MTDVLLSCGESQGEPAPSRGPGADPKAAGGTLQGGLPAEQRVGIALVGLGKLTLGELLPAFAQSKLCRPAALVSGDRAKAERVAAQYGIAKAHIYDYASFDRLRDDPSVDVVYVVLPNSMHAEFTIRAARAGKHVLCEKPMANTVAECQQMIDACDQAKKQLMIAYRMQYEPYNREVIRMARSGELGKLRNFVTSNGQREKDPKEWRLNRALAGGGALPDVGIYCLNAARYITGEEPIEVAALLHRPSDDPRFQQVEEQVDFNLRFPSGFLASCACAYDTYNSKSFRLLGEKAWVELDPAYSYRGQRMRIGTAADEDNEMVTERQLKAENQFALEMDHMAECVRDKRRPYTPGEEGMQDMRIIAAIYSAAESGKVVKLEAATKPDAYRGPAPA